MLAETLSGDEGVRSAADGTDDQTDSRLRPFRRRAFSTFRPAFERMRTRNPCVFFRRLLFGWYVLFIGTLTVH